MSLDWKPIILHGGGIGALLALWAGVWAMGFLVCWGNGWLYPGVEIPARWAETIRYSPEEVLGIFGTWLNLDLPTQPLSFLLLMTVLGGIAGAFIASIGRLTSLDPAAIGLRTFSWSLRAMVSRASLPMWMVTIIGVVLPISSGIDNLIFFVLAVFVLWLAVVPWLMWRSAVAEGPALGSWWTPWWPGWKTVSLVLLIEMLVLFPEVLFWWVPEWAFSAPGIKLIMWPVQTGWWVFSVTAPLCLCSLLMAISSSTEWRCRWIFKWRILGPWAALHLWWLTIPVLLAPPSLVVYVWLWKFAPVLATIVESQGQFLPYGYHLFINTVSVVGNFLWMMVLVPATFFFWLGVARFVVLTHRGTT